MVGDSLIRRLGNVVRRHGWDGAALLLLAGGLALGGGNLVSGAGKFAAALVPGTAEASDEPARAGAGVARLPVFGFAQSSYAPAVLFPVTTHVFPDWLRFASIPALRLLTPAAPVSAAPARVAAVAPAALPLARDPVMAICIDDLGEDLAGTDKAMALPKEVALSFLPYAEATPFLAQESEHRGHDVLAHVPMQALSATDPGAMALKVGSPDIAARLEWNIDRVPGLVGINNHEGSRFTQDADSLAPVTRLLAQRHLFFFDSRTGPDSKVGAVAQGAGVMTAGRDIFLDDVVSEEAVRAQLDALAATARHQGAAIAIGHPHDVTLRVLAAWLAENHGVTLVRLPEAMTRKSQDAVALASR